MDDLVDNLGWTLTIRNGSGLEISVVGPETHPTISGMIHL